MTIHLVKLCVGAESLKHHQDWITHCMALRRENGRPIEQIHTTRMTPKRSDELLDGGSLYWVIKGLIQARQTIIDLRPIKDADNIKRCQIVLNPELIITRNAPRKAFQGWRYLAPEDAPEDLSNHDHGLTDQALPLKMRQELYDLGLL